MRVALISLAGQPHDADGSPLRVAGKTLAERQLDFALAAGAERIVVLGDGAAPEAIALRHRAEAAGARFQAIRDSHGLLGAASATDELLVLAPGLLPEAAEAAELLGTPAVLVAPAEEAVGAGFERIDLQRAWLGALVLQGRLIEPIAELPANAEPAHALLRIALQAKLKERRLPDAAVADGSWAMIAADRREAIERGWLERNLGKPERLSLSAKLADAALRLSYARALGDQRTGPLTLAGAAALLSVAVALAWLGFAAAGFLILAVAVLLATLHGQITRLAAAPFGMLSLPWRRAVPWAVDLALAACAAGAIEGGFAHKLFPPVVFVAALDAWPNRRWPGAQALVRDRAVLALLLAFAAALGHAEEMTMLLALALIGQIRLQTRITAA